MPGRLNMLLRLLERQPDRVLVAVRLSPTGVVQVEGVAVQLFDSAGESLSSRLLLPLAGEVSGPLATTTELRSHEPIPPGGKVVATAWTEHGVVETSCPTEPSPDLHDHLRGRGLISMFQQRTPLHGLRTDERCRLAVRFGWLAVGVPCPPRVVEDETSAADEVCEDLGLEGDDAAWVRGLMAED